MFEASPGVAGSILYKELRWFTNMVSELDFYYCMFTNVFLGVIFCVLGYCCGSKNYSSN